MKLETYINEVAGVKAWAWAKAHGFPVSLVYDWIKGKHKPTIENLLKITKATKGEVVARDFNGSEG